MYFEAPVNKITPSVCLIHGRPSAKEEKGQRADEERQGSASEMIGTRIEKEV